MAHQQKILEAFFLLSPDRPVNMGGVGAIPTTAIIAMAEVIGEDPWIFLWLCRNLDVLYLAKQASRPKS